jgi:hypothetical protein
MFSYLVWMLVLEKFEIRSTKFKTNTNDKKTKN